MKVKTIPSFILLGCVLTITGCSSSDDSDECPTDSDPSLAVWGFSSIEILAKPSDSSSTNYDISIDETEFEWSNFILSSVMGVTEAEANRQAKYGWAQFFFNSAHASCLATYGVSRESVERIDIVSNVDYSPEFPAGTLLNSVFGYNGISLLFEPAGQVNHVIFNYNNLEYPSLSNYFSNTANTAAPVQFVLKPLLPVAEDSVHVFTLNYVLETGEVFTIDTKPIRLLATD